MRPYLVILLLYFIGRTLTNASDVEQKMINTKVVPDVIDEPPDQLLKVMYAYKAIQFGGELKPSVVLSPPLVSWTPENYNTFYTLVMTDPDVPSRSNPVLREWHHWLVTNIPGDRFSKGEVLSEYMGPNPPRSSGVHRYVFLVFKQPKKLEFTEEILSNRNAARRAHFSTRNFIEKYRLGTPVAGNMFTSTYDEMI